MGRVSLATCPAPSHDGQTGALAVLGSRSVRAGSNQSEALNLDQATGAGQSPLPLTGALSSLLEKDSVLQLRKLVLSNISILIGELIRQVGLANHLLSKLEH